MPIDGLKWGELPAASAPAPASSRPRPAIVAAPVDQERARRVEAVRRAVEMGVYRVDTLEIADRLLERRVLEGDEDV
jgi:hypothetical protein